MDDTINAEYDLDGCGAVICLNDTSAYTMSVDTVAVLNAYRKKYLETKDKRYWWQMIQLLPSSYNQKRTVMLNYQVLKNMYFARKNHRLDEWRTFCEEVEKLPYFKEICIEPVSYKNCWGDYNHTTEKRQDNDYYATDPLAIDALINDGAAVISNPIWECACGEGHLSKRLSELGYTVYSTDLVNRGYGDNFLIFCLALNYGVVI